MTESEKVALSLQVAIAAGLAHLLGRAVQPGAHDYEDAQTILNSIDAGLGRANALLSPPAAGEG